MQEAWHGRPGDLHVVSLGDGLMLSRRIRNYSHAALWTAELLPVASLAVNW